MKNIKLLPILGLAALLTSCEKKETVVYQQPESSTIDNNTVTENNSKNNASVATDQNSSTPEVVNSFIQKYYPNIGIARNEIKTSTINGTSYEVTLADDSEIEIKENGEWKEVKDIKGIPNDLLPANIKSYLETNYKNIVVEKIEKESRGYKIDLINNIDLEFDSNGNFKRIDK